MGKIEELEEILKLASDIQPAGFSDAVVVGDILGLILVAKEALENPKYTELYVTECVNCCSSYNASYRASYRLFSAVPQFSRIRERGEIGVHPDTLPNRNIMLCKCYDQKDGLAERISKIISNEARRLERSNEVPGASIIYKVK